MMRYLNLILRLAIWFLLTADFSLANITIGIFIAIILPQSYKKNDGSLKDWLQALWEAIVALPQAYIEALEIMIRPHNYEEVVLEKVRPNRTPGLIFLDILVITFTPKTIVVSYTENDEYEVHYVRRRKKS